MCEVVGEHLVHVGATVGGEVAHGLAHHVARELDDVGRGGEIGCGQTEGGRSGAVAHAREVTER